MDIDKIMVGLRIRQIRQNKGMTLEEFGNLLNAGKSNVSKWEKGSSLPNNDRLRQIAKIADTTVNELLYGTTWEYALKKINDICNKYKITDSYFYNFYDSLSKNERNFIKEKYPNTHVKTAVINYVLNTRGGDNFKLSYDLIDTKGFEVAFLTEIGFNAAMQDLTLKEKVTQYLNSITDIEIKSFQNQKYKEFYNQDIKEDAIKFMLTSYDFNGLTDIGIKSWTKELAEVYLDRLELFRNYKPYSDSNAVNLAVDLLRERFKGSIDDYFKKDNLPVEELNLPVEDVIKDELSYETYSKIIEIIEKAYEDIKEIK